MARLFRDRQRPPSRNHHSTGCGPSSAVMSLPCHRSGHARKSPDCRIHRKRPVGAGRRRRLCPRIGQEGRPPSLPPRWARKPGLEQARATAAAGRTWRQAPKGWRPSPRPVLSRTVLSRPDLPCHRAHLAFRLGCCSKGAIRGFAHSGVAMWNAGTMANRAKSRRLLSRRNILRRRALDKISAAFAVDQITSMLQLLSHHHIISDRDNSALGPPADFGCS